MQQVPPMSSKTPGSFPRWAFAPLLALAGAVGPANAAVASVVRPASSFEVETPASRAEIVTPGFTFDLVKNGAVATCLPNARGVVKLTSRGASQQMDVLVTGLPPNNTFTVFVLQLPHAPFGLAWYQGDVETDAFGVGHARFAGIFSDETFVMAPGVGTAPLVDPSDATTNPLTPPIHMFHIGLWFDSTAEAQAAHCPVGQTPFNGDHKAGIQVLNTTNFADGDGPIGQFGQ
jgi:hypothetical protein